MSQLFSVGIADVVPKSIAQGILLPVLQIQEPTRLICKETGLDILLVDLAVHRLDLVIADRPIPSTMSTRGFNHKLGECSISFFAKESIINRFDESFPQCLNGMPMLLPTRGTQLRSDIDQWISKTRIHSKIVAEFDDRALMKFFGQKAAGVFIAPTVLRKEVEDQYNVNAIGEVSEVKEAFYAISVERRITNPITATVIEAANNILFN